MGRHTHDNSVAIALLAFSMCFWSGPASAYVDPNASGLLFQILAPIVTLVMAAVVFVRSRIADAWRALYEWGKRVLAGEE
jgi:hypothetical protein